MRSTSMNTGNFLLDRLPADVIERLRPHTQRVRLGGRDIVHLPGDSIEHLHFPLTCVISVTVMMAGGQTVEAGAVGSREVVGINAFMGGRETTQTTYATQISGEAIRIDARSLKREFDRNAELRNTMLKYTQVMIAQLSQNVACNRLHDVGEKCARWLLEVSDRVRSSDFFITQEFMSEMLGVTRVSVTHAMSNLKQAGVIDYARGNVKIKDREKLETLACECYTVLRSEYDRLFNEW